MNLIFKTDGSFVMAQKNANKFYQDNKDYIVESIEDYDIEYSYTYNNEIVKGDKFVISDEEIKQIEADLIATSHEQPRKKEYPSIEEQLDKLFHDIKNGNLDKNGHFYKAITEVKDKYPKAK
tara:strand:- start:11 stop:376 length:366 start_codon:yes stop_codon:yes gene_type:complete